MSETKQFDVIVIGAGPGGYHAAIRAAQLGMKVAVVEKDDGTGIGGLGGVCLNWGCIPSKSLLKNAEVVNHLKEADVWGIQLQGFNADMAKAVERSRKVSAQLTKGIGFLLRKHKIELLQGKGSLASADTVEVEGLGKYKAGSIVIATGASPRSLPGIEMDGASIISSRQALELKKKPASIAIVGASAIGCEFAYYFNAYGVDVTIFEIADRLVPKEDADISKELLRQFKKRGIDAKVGASISKVEKADGGLKISYEAGGAREELKSQLVLLGVGVKPNSEGIGLEKVGVKTEKGFIEVDGHMRTSVGGVYAIGDVNGKLPLAHVAFEQGVIAAEAIAGKEPAPLNNYAAIPRCTYCQPEIASIGLTEEEARAQGLDIKTVKVPFGAAGKSIAINESSGFAKLVVDSATGEVHGAHLIGANATEMIAELGMLKHLEGTHDEVRTMVHAHPTLSEIIKEAAGAVTGEAIHI